MIDTQALFDEAEAKVRPYDRMKYAIFNMFSIAIDTGCPEEAIVPYTLDMLHQAGIMLGENMVKEWYNQWKPQK
jgi:hypothetical protein